MSHLPYFIPVFKKKVDSFLSSEDGNIKKEALVKAGIVAAFFSIAASAAIKTSQAAITCDYASNEYGSPQCSGNPVRDCDPYCNTQYDPFHANQVKLEFKTGAAVGTHNHCVETCHANQQHSDHSSGAMPCTW